MRKVLLVEPKYRNKYPPIGLMKLATYHKMLGDQVTFFKGDIKDLILDNIVNQCLAKLYVISPLFNWKSKYNEIFNYIKTRNSDLIDEILFEESDFKILETNSLVYFKDFYWKKEYLKYPLYDRICITTLFTFYWDITLKTIEDCKQLVTDKSAIWVGGITASVMTNEIKDYTGLNNVHFGLLDKPGILDKNNIVIDNLALDYSILDEIEYKYPERDAYYAYTTRGCVRKCSFCAVPVIEPKYNKYIPIKENLADIANQYGEKRNLLLMDNNVLASPCFDKIISEIKASGFCSNAKFVEPNQLDIAVKSLSSGVNVKANINKIVNLYHELIEKLKGELKQDVYNLLYDKFLLNNRTATVEEIININDFIAPLYEKYRNKASKTRYVDFNQGVDARLLTEEKIKLLSEIPIRPLRIAFDSICNKEEYILSIKMAKKYKIRHFSNYLLYNYEDTPLELYERLKINVELCDSLSLDIYSFPMKYHPIFGDTQTNRNYIGKHWNRKFIRAIQVILNATKGKVGRGKSFFYKAFGENIFEFYKLLYMPEVYIFYRLFYENNGAVLEWWNAFCKLSESDLVTTKSIIEHDDFDCLEAYKNNANIYNVLKHYKVKRSDVESLIKISKMTEIGNVANYGIV